MEWIRRLMMLLFAACLVAGCSNENVSKDGEDPQPGGDGNDQRREVMLMLNNELLLKQTTRADGTLIATAEENAISSLDVFVFGSEREDGDYTFQERFAYRADDTDPLPSGASLLDLKATDATQKQTQGLLKLKKGLFVKLYCVANCQTLINPATKNPVEDTDFVPLTFTAPEKAGRGVATEGKPTELNFITFHTPLLDAAKADDILLTPLAMSGAYTTPLDLTDFETSSRVQLSFKLTRLAARFDIVNKADESRFAIREVTMSKGRRGATFFPIKIYGQTPTAVAGELITYPVRKFDGDKANIGTQTGAFYSYPSPSADGGFLILKGTYKVNETEEKEVSYQIPFIQYTGDGNSTTLEINNNHRYTVGITKADDYHLDFTLDVADWTDSGKIDDYTPGENEAAVITVDIPAAFEGKTIYKEETKTVAMFIKDPTSNFDLQVRSSVPLTLKKSYAGILPTEDFDWLKVEDKTPLAKAVMTEYTYNLSLISGYNKKRYPKAVLRFMNLMDGSESVIFVDAMAAPSLNVTPQPSGSFNEFDAVAAKATMYKTTGSSLVLTLTCPDGVEVAKKPDWLELSKTEVSGTETTFTFTLTGIDIPDAQEKITFSNKKEPEFIVDVTVDLEDASIVPDFEAVKTSPNNKFTAATESVLADIAMNIAVDNSFTIKTSTLAGVSVSFEYEPDSPQWLQYTGATMMNANAMPNTLVFSLKQGKFATGQAKKATVTLGNLGGGKDYKFTITPVFLPPSLSVVASSASPAQNTYDDVTKTLSLYQVNGSTIKLKASSLGGNKIIDSKGVSVTGGVADDYRTDQEYTITWDDHTTSDCSFTLANLSDDTKTQKITVQMEDASIHPKFSSTSGNNTYDSGTKKVTMNIVDKSVFTFETTSPTGVTAEIKYKDGSSEWLKVVQTKAVSVSNNITFGLNNNALSSGQAKTATVTLKNNIGGEDFVFTVEPEFQIPVLSSSKSVTLNAEANTSQEPTTTITGTCLGGSVIEGLDWITCPTTEVAGASYSYRLSLDPATAGFPTSLPPQKTITIKNRQAPDKSVTVNLTFTEVNAWIPNTPSGLAEISGDNLRLSTNGGTMTVSLYTMFTPPSMTYLYDNSYCNSTNGGNSWITSVKKSDPVIVEKRRRYTFTVNVKSSSGTDADYQLHKGTLTIKHGDNGSLIKTYTLWRGASFYGYPAGVGSPYYSAIKYRDKWWAPVNLGATRVSTSGSDTSGRGLYYQWGRSDGVSPGCSIVQGPTNSPNRGVFYYVTSAIDWRSTKDDNLWTGSGGTANPCPSGWHVPDRAVLNSLTGGVFNASNYLYTISSSGYPSIVLPLCGELTRDDGKFKHENENARYWSSSPNGNNMYFLSIVIRGEKTIANAERSYGWSIRCVKN